MTQLQVWALAAFVAIVILAFVMLSSAQGRRKHRPGGDPNAGAALPFVAPVLFGDGDDGADHSGGSDGGSDAGGGDGGGG